MNSPATSPSKRRSSTPRRASRILVVDDDRDEVLTLTALLKDEGYEVNSLFTGAQVMEAVRDFAPDVVLLDIGLPDRNGYDLARQINSRYGEDRPRLIAVTGWKKASDRMLAQMAGFDHHVAKPYDPKVLLGLITPRSAA